MGDSAAAGQEPGAPPPSIVNVFGHGDFWIVKSPQVNIQGRYGPTQWTENGLSATLALAVGGPFLQGHVLIIEPQNGQITWDGEPILQEFPSDWSVPGLITARYHELEEPISKAMLHMPMVHGIDVELPQDLRITVNRWSKHVDLVIHMRAQAGGQDGHCGNFNGDASDDSMDVIKARMELKVPDEDLLFPKPNPLAGDAEPKVREFPCVCQMCAQRQRLSAKSRWEPMRWGRSWRPASSTAALAGRASRPRALDSRGEFS